MHTHNDFAQPSNGTVWRDRLLTAGAAIIFGLTLSNVAPADEVSRDKKRAADARHDAAVSQAKADYKAARAKCNELAGNDKDVCVKEAKAARTTATADAKAQLKVRDARVVATDKTNAARVDAVVAKTDANYAVAIEKCKAFANEAKSTCVAEAKMYFGK